MQPTCEERRIYTDTDRLDLLIEKEARVAPWVGGGYRVCRNWEGRLRWYGRPQPTPKSAIDSAIEECRGE